MLNMNRIAFIVSNYTFIQLSMLLIWNDVAKSKELVSEDWAEYPWLKIALGGNLQLGSRSHRFQHVKIYRFASFNAFFTKCTIVMEIRQ